MIVIRTLVLFMLTASIAFGLWRITGRQKWGILCVTMAAWAWCLAWKLKKLAG